jgi:hypothetical protein
MIKIGKLSWRYVWFMIETHFWLRVLYSLCTVSASYKVLLECLTSTYCNIHPQRGIQQSARRGTRQLGIGFYSVGCPHPAIKCLISQLNKMLMHYGNQSCLGLQIQNTMELLVIELGMSPQPFQEEYKVCHHWVTHSWMKSVWEKAHHLWVEIDIANLPVHPPWERDSWLMQEFVHVNYNCNAIWRLNQVRVHQEVLFLLNVMDASGWSINRKYLNPAPMGKHG